MEQLVIIALAWRYLLSTYRMRQGIAFWQIGASLAVAGYLTTCVLTGTIKSYHWVLLGIVPLALFHEKPTRRFLLDWLPIIAFWLAYDRLRLVQPLLLSRVAVEWPYELELRLFGWLGGGDVPAHSWDLWLSAPGGATRDALSVAAQMIYLSHMVLLPALLFFWWSRQERGRFTKYVRAFSILHAMALLTYVTLPVAPPWWISLHRMSQPTAQLVAQTNVRDAMHGVVVQGLIGNAAQWFAAVPSLHGAYPVLMFLLSLGERKWFASGVVAAYAVAMFAATVSLNQHYFIDLLAGLCAACIAYLVEGSGVLTGES